MNDNTINDAVRCESGAVFEDLATEDEFRFIGRDACYSSNAFTKVVDEGGLGSRQGDVEGFTVGLFDANGDAHDGWIDLVAAKGVVDTTLQPDHF